LYIDSTLIGTTPDDELNAVVGRGEGLEKIIHAPNRTTSRLHDQVALCQAGPRGWTVVLHMAYQQPLSIWQTDGAPHPTSNVRWCYANAKPDPSLRLTSSQCVHSSLQRLISGDREIETLAETVGVQAKQPSLRVDDRAARGPRKKWGVVLNASGDSTAPRSAEAPLETCDEAQCDAQSSATGI
jgi:hypothetical protein